MQGNRFRRPRWRGERFPPKTNETAEHPPMSKAQSGSCHWLETAFWRKGFSTALNAEHEMPFGGGIRNSRASAVKATARLLSQSLER